MFDKKTKTRRGRLEAGLEGEISKGTLNVDSIIELVEVYEQDNRDTIEKCRRDKRLEMNKINGALKQSIDAHGDITKVLIGSTSKRIYGSLLLDYSEPKPYKFSISSMLIGASIGIILSMLIVW